MKTWKSMFVNVKLNEPGNERQEVRLCVSVHVSTLPNKNCRRLLCWVIVTWLIQCLPQVTAAAPLIACLHWMMGYLIPTHSTQLLFTVAEAWGGSRGSLWPYGEGGRAHAEWLEAYRLTHAPDWLLYCTEPADRTGSSRTNETHSTHTTDHTHICMWDVVRCEMQDLIELKHTPKYKTNSLVATVLTHIYAYKPT